MVKKSAWLSLSVLTIENLIDRSARNDSTYSLGTTNKSVVKDLSDMGNRKYQAVVQPKVAKTKVIMVIMNKLEKDINTKTVIKP